MANINLTSFSDISGFQVSGCRHWTNADNYLKPISEPTSPCNGLITYETTQPSLNGTLTAEYVNLYPYESGKRNGLVLRAKSLVDFIALRIDPGLGGDPETAYVERNTFYGDTGYGAIQLSLYDSNNLPIAPAWNNIYLTTTGKVVVTIKNDYQYTFNFYNNLNVFKCSATWTDTYATKSTNGKLGFYHNGEYENGWYGDVSSGWKSLSWQDSAAVYQAPSIQYFIAVPSTIEYTDSSNLSWGVLSGDSATSVYLSAYDGTVTPQGLIGTGVVSPPSTKSYLLSAYNLGGSVSSSVQITVVDNVPKILMVSAYPTTAAENANATIYVKTDDSTSAFGDSGLGWYTFPTSGVETYGFSTSVDTTTTYTISAYNPFSSIPAVSSTTLYIDPDPQVIMFGGDSPVCSGSILTLSWSTQDADYLNIEPMHFSVPSEDIASGSYAFPSSAITYSLVASNSVGVSSTALYTPIIYSFPPEIHLSAYDGTTYVPSGSMLDIQSTSGRDILIDASHTFDPDGHVIDFIYYKKTDGDAPYEYITSGVGLETITYPISAGTNIFGVVTKDPCGYSTSASYELFGNSNIPPVAIISPCGYKRIQSALTIGIDGSGSYDPEGNINKYVWYTGTELEIVYSEGETGINPTCYDPGLYKFRLRVYDNDGNYSDSETLVVDFVPYVELVVSAGEDVYNCVETVGGTSTVRLDGSQSYAVDSTITSAYWHTEPYVSVAVDGYEPSGIVVDVLDVPSTSQMYKNYCALWMWNSNDIFAVDDVLMASLQKPSLSATYTYNSIVYDISDSNVINIEYPDLTALVTFTAYITNVDKYGDVFGNNLWEEYFNYTWFRNDVIIGTDRTLSKTIYPGDASTYYCLVEFNSDVFPNMDCSTSLDSFELLVNGYDSDFSIDYFYANPSILNYVSQIPSTVLNWSIQGADSAWIINNTYGVTPVDPVSGTMTVQIAYTDSFILSASRNGVPLTADTYIKVNTPPVPGQELYEISKTKLDYISLYAPEMIRYSVDRFIRLSDYVPRYLVDTDIGQIVQVFEDYLNTMFTGDNGYTISTSAVDTTLVCDSPSTSAYCLSGVPYTYSIG